MEAALIALIGVVVAAVISHFTARYTANKAFAGVRDTNITKKTEVDQGYVKWACDMVARASSDAEVEYGVSILRGLKEGNQLGLQDRIVVQAVLRRYTARVTDLLGDLPPASLAESPPEGDGGT